jgi:hypothetical protein
VLAETTTGLSPQAAQQIKARADADA